MEKERLILAILINYNAYDIENAVEFDQIVDDVSDYGLTDVHLVEIGLNTLVDRSILLNSTHEGHHVFWIKE